MNPLALFGGGGFGFSGSSEATAGADSGLFGQTGNTLGPVNNAVTVGGSGRLSNEAGQSMTAATGSGSPPLPPWLLPAVAAGAFVVALTVAIRN